MYSHLPKLYSDSSPTTETMRLKAHRHRPRRKPAYILNFCSTHSTVTKNKTSSLPSHQRVLSPTYRHTDRQTDRQTDRLTDRQKERKKEKKNTKECSKFNWLNCADCCGQQGRAGRQRQKSLQHLVFPGGLPSKYCRPDTD